MIHIDNKTMDNCYNEYESFGEICVGCGCCSDDPLERTKARIELHERILDRLNHAEEEMGILSNLQKRNIWKDTKMHEKELAKLRKELEEIEANILENK